jgi:hypothetical protein
MNALLFISIILIGKCWHRYQGHSQHQRPRVQCHPQRIFCCQVDKILIDHAQKYFTKRKDFMEWKRQKLLWIDHRKSVKVDLAKIYISRVLEQKPFILQYWIKL